MDKTSARKTMLAACAGAALLAACKPASAPLAVQQAPATPASIADALPNADYPVDAIATGTAPLRNGLYEEALPNSSSKTSVRLDPMRAYGDLDGNGSEDAAVLLRVDPGGSGSFAYVAAVLNADGVAKPVASLAIGDRITVKSLRIVDGTVVATWLDRKAGEPMTSPATTVTTRSLVVRDGKLVDSAAE